MVKFPRLVLGYHGCEASFADALIAGEVPIGAWEPSRKPYDWLGHGIYFWEFGPERARAWAHQRGKIGVVGAVIQLGACLDLTDVAYTRRLGRAYESLKQMRVAAGEPMPENKGGWRALDCFVINELVAAADNAGVVFQTVRCPFLEGEPAFEGSAILRESHIQLAVRDTSCIVGVFRPPAD